MADVKYTELQLKIINEEIPLESIDGRAAIWLYKKALMNGDVDVAEKAQAQIVQAKAEASRKNCERTSRAKALCRKGIFQWTQPKSSDYTDYQKRIVRGEIPLDKIQSTHLINTYKKAITLRKVAFI